MLCIHFYIKYLSNLDKHIQIENQWLYCIMLFSVVAQIYHKQALSAQERPLTEIINSIFPFLTSV